MCHSDIASNGSSVPENIRKFVLTSVTQFLRVLKWLYSNLERPYVVMYDSNNVFFISILTCIVGAQPFLFIYEFVAGKQLNARIVSLEAKGFNCIIL